MNSSVALTTTPDTDLVDAARKGNQDAFAQLLERHRHVIRSIARAYFAVGASDEDLQQEAFIGLLKAVRDFRADLGAFRSFAELCIRRQVITFIKAQTRQKHRVLNWAVSLDEPQFDSDGEPLINRLTAEPPLAHDSAADEFIRRLRERCSVLECQVLELYTTGYSFEEMAQETGTHWKAIDNAVWRVKVKAKRLREELQWPSL